MKVLFSLFLIVNCPYLTLGQTDTVFAPKVTEIEVTIKPYSQKAYDAELERVRAIYPLALHAKKLLDMYDDELAVISKKRKKRKYTREAHNKLKSDFYWSIRDMYSSDGELLMKLVHRETEMTVHQIIQHYRGKFRSDIYDFVGKGFDHDLDIKYHPKGADWLTEIIIQDIKKELVIIDFTPDIKSKKEAKTNLKEYRKDVRASSKAMRRSKREARKIKD